MLYETMRLGTHQKVTFGAAAVPSGAISPNVFKVRVVATIACYIKVDAAPVATAADIYIPPNHPEYFTVTPGQKISALQATAGGDLHITELV